MVWMAMRGRSGAALLQSRPRVKARGLGVVGDTVMESNNPYDEGETADCKITQICELERTRDQNSHGLWRV